MLADPRLIELELLAALDAKTAEGKYVRYLKPNPFGGQACLVHEAYLGLIRDLAVTGDPRGGGARHVVSPDPHPDPLGALKRTAVSLLSQLEDTMEGSNLRITHDGRLRLSRLRAELDLGRIRDKFGILCDDRHWAADLLVRSLMRAPAEPIALVVADLDHFKSVNDKLGHEQGDQGIRTYRTIIREVVAAVGGEAYAMGGDEAACIMQGIDLESATKIGTTLLDGIRDAFKNFGFAHGKQVLPRQPTASIGIGVFGAFGDLKGARTQVDSLMYEAKEAGRDRLVVQQVASEKKLPAGAGV